MSDIKIYRDDSVILDFPMPETLRNLVQEADEFFEKDDWFWYDTRVREIESTTKQEVLCGLLTEEQFHKVWRRYYLE